MSGFESAYDAATASLTCWELSTTLPDAASTSVQPWFSAASIELHAWTLASHDCERFCSCTATVAGASEAAPSSVVSRRTSSEPESSLWAGVCSAGFVPPVVSDDAVESVELEAEDEAIADEAVADSFVDVDTPAEGDASDAPEVLAAELADPPSDEELAACSASVEFCCCAQAVVTGPTQPLQLKTMAIASTYASACFASPGLRESLRMFICIPKKEEPPKLRIDNSPVSLGTVGTLVQFAGTDYAVSR